MKVNVLKYYDARAQRTFWTSFFPFCGILLAQMKLAYPINFTLSSMLRYQFKKKKLKFIECKFNYIYYYIFSCVVWRFAYLR